jgi:hypothetical protein
MLREDQATVLPFRDAAVRRPIDVVAWINTYTPRPAQPGEVRGNVIPLGSSARLTRRRRWCSGPSGDEAA